MGLPIKIKRIPRTRDKQYRALELMRSLIQRGRKDPRIREFAARAVRGTAEGDFSGEVRALANKIKSRVRYTRDPNQHETIADAWDTLRLGYGDCDDLVVLGGAALESIGHPVRIKVAGQDGRFSHVYLETFIRDVETRSGSWVPVDLARPAEKVFLRRTFPQEKTYTMEGYYL